VDVPGTLDVLPRQTFPGRNTPYNSVDVFSFLRNLSCLSGLNLNGLSLCGVAEHLLPELGDIVAGLHIPMPHVRSVRVTCCWLYPHLCERLKVALRTRHDVGAPPLELILGKETYIYQADYENLCSTGIVSVVERGMF
jgi:hypothetical protein